MKNKDYHTPGVQPHNSCGQMLHIKYLENNLSYSLIRKAIYPQSMTNSFILPESSAFFYQGKLSSEEYWVHYSIYRLIILVWEYPGPLQATWRSDRALLLGNSGV